MPKPRKQNKLIVRINISLNPNPLFDDWIHIPVSFLLAHKNGPAIDTKINPTDARILAHFRAVDRSCLISITDNGGPSSWAERIHMVLQEHGYNCRVDENKRPDLFPNPDRLFDNELEPLKWVDISAFSNDIKRLFDLYWSQIWQLEEHPNTICGHRRHSNALWTQVNSAYDPTISSNAALMTEMKNLYNRLVPWFVEVLKKHQVRINDLESRLTLRLIHYLNNDDVRTTIKDHVDASVITMILHQDQPGLKYYCYKNSSYRFSETTCHDAGKQLAAGNALCLPGVVYKDELSTWTPPLWHGVNISNEQDRLSLVFRVEEKRRK